MHDLFNEVVLGLSTPKRSLFRHQPNKSGDWAVRQARATLVSATKMTVGDNLLRHAVTASFMRPKYIFDALFLGRPPFDVMWIEWNAKKAMYLLKEEYESRGWDYRIENADQHQDRVGYLIYRMPRGTYAYSQFLRDDASSDILYDGVSLKGKLFFPPNAIYVDHDIEQIAMPNSGRMLPRDISLEEEPHMSEFDADISESYKDLLSRSYARMYTDERSVNLLTQIYDRMNFGRHPLADITYPEITGALHPNRQINWDMMKRAHGMTTEMMSGDLRLLFVLLGLLNYPQHIYEAKVEDTVPRKMWGRQVPRNEIKLMEIDLPKPNGTKFYQSIFKGHGSPKRRHLRRGHWRIVHHKSGETTRRWIEAQMVGNAELGTIVHDYHLTKKSSKPKGEIH